MIDRAMINASVVGVGREISQRKNYLQKHAGDPLFHNETRLAEHEVGKLRKIRRDLAQYHMTLTFLEKNGINLFPHLITNHA